MKDGDSFFSRRMIEEEKNELIMHAQCNLWKSDFWKPLYYNLIEKHSYQKEFYLVGEKPTQREVEVYLHKVLKLLSVKYRIKCKRQTTRSDIILELGLSYDPSVSRKQQGLLKNEITVRVSNIGIYLMVLPYCSLATVFELDEYRTVGNVITEFCHELFNAPDPRFTAFKTYRKKLEEDVRFLTVKTIEIAQSSIKSFYETSDQKDKQISQTYLFSKLLIDGEEILIRHKAFLDNPQILISKLQKK